MVFHQVPGAAFSRRPASLPIRGQISIRWMAPGPPIENEGFYFGPLGKIGFYYVPPGFVGNWAVLSAPEGTWLEGEELYRYYANFLDSFTAPAIV